ncbi:hypothetical protein EB796_019048 [Bugula neritina]|uniref:Uncharacterized protein n=1 Tax=Bugula neritina TaxID=10212 RepID=A0A7J7J9C7_BUGNE|nr:hypothetical protein EB796_019048 [Bugula neritina]
MALFTLISGYILCPRLIFNFISFFILILLSFIRLILLFLMIIWTHYKQSYTNPMCGLEWSVEGLGFNSKPPALNSDANPDDCIQ